MRLLLTCTALSTLLPTLALAQPTPENARKSIYIGPPGHGHLHSDKKTGTLKNLPDDMLPRIVDDTAPRPSLADEKRVGRPGPEQDAAVYLEKLSVDNSVLMDAKVELLGAPTTSDHRWSLDILERPLFLSRLLELREVENLPPIVPDIETGYAGFKITLINHDGTQYAPIYVFRDTVRMYGTHPRLRDSGNNVEAWLASTAKTVGQFNTVAQLIPPATYEDCQVMGFQVLYSTPRQCVLADGTTFIEGARPKDPQTPSVTTYDACAADSQNRIIDTFPRKCIAPGGRLLIEPPPPIELKQESSAVDALQDAVNDPLPAEPTPAAPLEAPLNDGQMIGAPTP